MEVNNDGRWVQSTSSHYGDWTFVDSSVTTGPTEIRLLRITGREAVVRWTYGKHATGAPGAHSQAYPFTKTLWLRSGEYGYYTWIEPLRHLPPDATYATGMSEHEVGFGGVWGPAAVITGQGCVRTDALAVGAEFSREDRPDAAELRLDDDPLVRILVPIPAARLYVPRFSATRFGGVFVHHLEPGPYGAYVYAAPRDAARSRVDIRRMAWREAPTEMLRFASRQSQ